MESRKIIKKLENDGCYLHKVTGSHHHFKHPLKKGTTTVVHPRKNTPTGTLKSIEKQVVEAVQLLTPAKLNIKILRECYDF